MVRRVYITRGGREFRGGRERALSAELRQFLGIRDLKGLHIYYRYDVEHLEESAFKTLSRRILMLPGRDEILQEVPPSDWILAVQMHEGQFDQRAEAVQLSLRLLLQDEMKQTSDVPPSIVSKELSQKRRKVRFEPISSIL